MQLNVPSLWKLPFFFKKVKKKNARELWPSGVLIQWMVQHGAGNLIITNKGRSMLPCSNFWKTSCFVTNSKRNQKQHSVWWIKAITQMIAGQQEGRRWALVPLETQAVWQFYFVRKKYGSLSDIPPGTRDGESVREQPARAASWESLKQLAVGHRKFSNAQFQSVALLKHGLLQKQTGWFAFCGQQ